MSDNNNNLPHFYYALRTVLDTGVVGQAGDGIAPPEVPSCCSPCKTIPVLAESGSKTNDLYNDKTTVVYNGLTVSDVFEWYLEKVVAGVWVEQTQFTDNTFGTKYDAGDLEGNPFLQAFIVDWFEVLDTYGVGNYRIRIEGSGLSDYTSYTLPYCLKEYSVYAANGTVRFDWIMSAEQPDVNFTRLKTDYALADLPMQIRLQGFFGYMEAEYEDREVDYENGNTESYRVETTPSYTFKSGKYWYTIHQLLMLNAFKNRKLSVTDYNIKNHFQDVKNIPIIATSGYAPNYTVGKHNMLSRVEMKFKDRKWDFGIKKC